MKFNFKVYLLLLGTFLTAQEIQLPKDLSEEYVFAQSQEGYPKIITKNGYYQFKTNWTYNDFGSIKNTLNNEILKSFNNQNFIALKDSIKTTLILSGGGHVFSQSHKGIKKEDSSVEQKNQFNASVFLYNNQIYMYGGYGFWSFKDYITFFDNATGQWEMLKTKSKYIPQARWKAIYQVLNEKLYVLGGRNSPKESANKDMNLKDSFYFDLIEKNFVNLGEINPKIPLKYSYGPSVIINNKKAYLEKDQIIFFDFKKDSAVSYFKKNLFEGIDIQRPAFEHLDTIYYIKHKKNTSFLVQFPVSNLNNLKPVFYSMFLKKKVASQVALGALSVFLICWIILKLFAYKDFIKELVLFDKKRIYYGKESFFLSEKQLLLIRHFEKKNQISTLEINKIISSKKYVKSHFTLLRTDFIKEINVIYKSVTNRESNLIEEAQNPLDNRFKIYRVTNQVFQKESFFSFLFKS